MKAKVKDTVCVCASVPVCEFVCVFVNTFILIWRRGGGTRVPPVVLALALRACRVEPWRHLHVLIGVRDCHTLIPVGGLGNIMGVLVSVLLSQQQLTSSDCFFVQQRLCNEYSVSGCALVMFCAAADE